jgi:hypothetical protein
VVGFPDTVASVDYRFEGRQRAFLEALERGGLFKQACAETDVSVAEVFEWRNNPRSRNFNEAFLSRWGGGTASAEPRVRWTPFVRQPEPLLKV